MKTEFTPFQYMLIHLANTYGMDKRTFEERIAWAKSAIKGNLEDFDSKAESVACFRQAWREIQKVKQGEPTGLMVAFDATSSFLQIMSALSGCRKSAVACNLIDPDKRYDAYGLLATLIQQAMPDLDFTRQQAKDLMMKSLAYGSEAVPRSLFTNDDDYDTYLRMMEIHFPGIMQVRRTLLSCWNPNVTHHAWMLPDGFEAIVPVMVRYDGQKARIEVSEAALHNNGRPKSLTYIHSNNEPSKYATSILARHNWPS